MGNSRKSLHIFLCSNTAWYLYNFRASTIVSFIADGHSVSCLAPYDSYVRNLQELGVRFIPIELDGENTSILREFMSFFSIYKMMREEKPDIVFNFTIKMNIYAGLCSKINSVPFVNNISGLGTVFIHDSLFYKIIQRLYSFSNKSAKCVFFQNQDDRKLFHSKAGFQGKKTVVLPGSGVDLAYFQRSPLPKASEFTFLMVSRLIADKGVREFVGAAKRVKSKYPHTRFILLGPSGVSNKSAILQDELLHWQGEGVVEFPGGTDDVRPWIRLCNILVLPSYREGMPKTVLEAAAMGRPAIVTDVPGCRQAVVDGVTGWLCKVHDIDSLADQMIAVMQPQVDVAAFAERAILRVRQEFSHDKVIQSYMDCLRFAKNRAS